MVGVEVDAAFTTSEAVGADSPSGAEEADPADGVAPTGVDDEVGTVPSPRAPSPTAPSPTAEGEPVPGRVVEGNDEGPGVVARRERRSGDASSACQVSDEMLSAG